MQVVKQCTIDETKSVQCEAEADIVLKIVRSAIEVTFNFKYTC